MPFELLRQLLIELLLDPGYEERAYVGMLFHSIWPFRDLDNLFHENLQNLRELFE